MQGYYLLENCLILQRQNAKTETCAVQLFSSELYMNCDCTCVGPSACTPQPCEHVDHGSHMVQLTCSGNCSKWHLEGLCITVCRNNRVSVEKTPTAKETIHYIVDRPEGKGRIFTLANHNKPVKTQFSFVLTIMGYFSFPGSSQN